MNVIPLIALVIASPQSFRSPDRSLVAKVTALKQLHKYGGNPSAIQIINGYGHVLARRDHSIFPNQGLIVCKAGWTKDSRFFVYETSEAGGHSPWHSPTFFYSRKKHRFYSLDAALQAFGDPGAVVIGGVSYLSKSNVSLHARYAAPVVKGMQVVAKSSDDSGECTLRINLRRLEPRLSNSSISSDEKDWKSFQEQNY